MEQPSLVSTEGRRSLRKRTLLGGEIIFNGGTSALDCLIRDLSDDGCRLALSSTAGVPTAFTLKITRDGRQFSARVRWRNDKFIGVEFTDIEDDTNPLEDEGQPAPPQTDLRVV